MAKRVADNQASKDDVEDDENEEPGVRDAPLAPIQGRVVRGLPKRRGLGAPAPVPVPAPAPAPVASIEPASAQPKGTDAATPNPFASFSFGGASTAGPSPFSFGQPATTPAAPAAPAVSAAPAPQAATPNPFSGFSFGAPAASSAPPPVTEASKTPAPFSFGQPASSASTEASKPSEARKPFGGFSFGAPSTAPKAPASQSSTAEPAKAAAPYSFGTTSESVTTTASKDATKVPSFGFGNTSVKAPPPVTKSNPALKETPKALPSFSFGSTSSSFGAATSQPSQPAPTTSVADTQTETLDPAEVSYYTSLRGLNQSIVNFFSTVVEKDQFIDLSEAIPNLGKQYEKHLRELEDKSGWKPEGSEGSLKKTKTSETKTSSVPAPPVSGFTMPKAPSGGFALPKPASGTKTPIGGGFTPSAAPVAAKKGSGFAFPPLPSATEPTTAAPASKTSGFSFSPAPSASESKNTSVENVPFGSARKSPEEKEPESSVEKTEEAMESDAPIAETAEEPKESAAPIEKPEEKKDEPKGAPVQPFKFELPKKANSLFSSSSSTPAKAAASESGAQPLGKFGPGGSAPVLSFGAKVGGSPASASSTTSSFSFGATSATGGSATGFSFGSFGGSSAPTPTATSSTAPSFSFGSTGASSSAPTFSFGAKPALPASAPASEDKVTPTSAEGDAEEASVPSLNLATTVGAGEEGEDTLYELRGKLNRLDEGKFILEGLGVFKLKKAKEGGKRRLLMRTDGNGIVILNMTLQPTFNPTVEASFLRFVGFNADGKPTMYALRVKNAEAAEKVKEALVKEVENLKGEETS